MQSSWFSHGVRWRRCFALVCLLAVVVVSGVQAAHWDKLSTDTSSSLTSLQNNDGLCPICFSVPVGHGFAPAAMLPIRVEGSFAVISLVPTSEGIQPEFHLHIRPPPAIA